MKSRRGQMKLSFGMIFSIILIIFFVAFAIYAIVHFLGFQKELTITQFYEEFQSDVDKMWKSTAGTQNLQYSLPENIQRVCFVKNSGDLELFEKNDNRIASKNIQHINLTATLGQENAKCFYLENGKINLKLIKKSSSPRVTVTDSNDE